MSSGQIWYQDPYSFMSREAFLQFFPTPDMTLAQKINAVMRFTIYFVLVMVLISGNLHYMYLLVGVAAVTSAIYELEKRDKRAKRENFIRDNLAQDVKTGESCVRPTQENPFMNVLMSEYSQNPERPKACDVEQEGVKDMIGDCFNESVIRDVDDIFYKKASDRQFYTTPNTKIPNDQDGFAKWLYNTGPTCKEGNGTMCYVKRG